MENIIEVPDRNLVYWLGIRDLKTNTKTDVYKNVISDKYYANTFTKDGSPISLNKEFKSVKDCYEHHCIMIDQLIN